jgi:hypothetical protein
VSRSTFVNLVRSIQGVHEELAAQSCLYLRFYQVYRQIVRSLAAQFPALIPKRPTLREKVRSAIAQSGVEPQDKMGAVWK